MPKIFRTNYTSLNRNNILGGITNVWKNIENTWNNSVSRSYSSIINILAASDYNDRDSGDFGSYRRCNRKIFIEVKEEKSMMTVFCAGGCIAVGFMLLANYVRGGKSDE